MSKFKVIYIDPPWGLYRDKANAGQRGAGFKYPTMSLEEIKSLPIKEIAEDDSVLFIWTCWPLIFETKEVIEAYGFEYKTIGFNWVKSNKKQTDTFFWAMGNYTRSNSEVCLIATRGKPKRVSASVHSVIMSPIEAHSKKPDEARKRIEQLYGDVSRIEIFARQEAAGWISIGNGISGRDIRDELQELINKKD